MAQYLVPRNECNEETASFFRMAVGTQCAGIMVAS
jgi:hypothetical protein